MSILADNLLIQCKTDVYHRVLGDAFLAEVPVLIDDEHDLDNRAAIDLGVRNYRGDKTGACVIVSAVAVLDLNTGQTPVPLMEISLVLEVMEDVQINAGLDGTGLNAGEIVARLVQLLHQCHLDDRFTGFRLADDGPIQEIFSEQQGQRGFALRFVADDAAFSVVASVQSVTIANAAGTITLTCGTASASIYYTTDGSYPGSGNPAATLYTAPFVPDAGSLVRAAAEKADHNPSKYVASLQL